MARLTNVFIQYVPSQHPSLKYHSSFFTLVQRCTLINILKKITFPLQKNMHSLQITRSLPWMLKPKLLKVASFFIFIPQRSIHFYCLIHEIQKIGGFNNSFSEKDRKDIWNLKFDYQSFINKVDSNYVPDIGSLNETVK